MTPYSDQHSTECNPRNYSHLSRCPADFVLCNEGHLSELLNLKCHVSIVHQTTGIYCFPPKIETQATHTYIASMLNKLTFLIILIVTGTILFLGYDVVFNSPSYTEDSSTSQLASRLHAKVCIHFNEPSVSPVHACGKFDVRYGARKEVSILQVFGVGDRNEQDWVISAAKALASQATGLSRIEIIFFEKLNPQGSPIRVETIQEK